MREGCLKSPTSTIMSCASPGGGHAALSGSGLTLYRNDVPEQVWMNLDYSPVIDDDGWPGACCVCCRDGPAMSLPGPALAESEARSG